MPEDQGQTNNFDQIIEDALDMVENVDGFYLVEFLEDGVYLTVYQPQGKGNPVKTVLVLDELHSMGITGLDEKTVRQALEEPDGQQVKIAESQEKPVQDGEVSVQVAPDKLSAVMQLFPPRWGGKPVTYEQACIALKEAGVTYGIDEEAVKRALILTDDSKTVTVARGVPAEDGRDAVITYHFEPDGLPICPQQHEDGSVDHYNLQLIQNVEEGQVLATKIQPTVGQPGMAVTGQTISPRPGKDRVFLAGKNTELDEENFVIQAVKRGHVVLKDRRVHVLPVYEINDVDFSTGNIDFYGNVIVRGGVKPGFQVKAEGDVEIYGSVEGGMVIAGGNVLLKQGLINQGQVKAGGNVFIKFVQSSSIQAGGSVLVQQEIRQSSVDADNLIQVNGKKGLIVGGICRAGSKLEAKVVGSSWATRTQLEVGLAPSLRSDYLKVSEALEACIDSLDKVSKATELLRKMASEQGGVLPKDKQILSIRLNKTEANLIKEREILKKKYQELEERIQRYKGQGLIIISSLVRPGVSVVIGQAKMGFQDDRGPVRLVEADGEIKIETYK